MATADTCMMRNSGVDVVGEIPWGSHFCLFYDTKEDLLDTLTWYFWAGLQNQEFCLWVVAPPVTKEDALNALWRDVPQADPYVRDGSLEIVPARDVYLPDGTFNLDRTLAVWLSHIRRAAARGYVGVRLAADTAWLESKDWKDFCEYEDSVNGAIANQRFAALCTYPLSACGSGEILDVVRTHQFALAKRRGSWDMIETAGHKMAKAEIKRLNDELEQRVIERTAQLGAVNEELTREVADRQRAENALRRTESYLLDAQRLASSGSWAWVPATREILHWSAECFRMYGFDPKDGLPKWGQWDDRIHPEDRPKRQQAIEEAIRRKSDYELDYRIVLPDQTIRHVRTVAHPVLSPSGDLVEFVGTVMDITERKRADEERERLRQLQADLAHVNRISTLGELAASLSHELKQPISASIANARVCTRWLSRDEPQVQKAREAASRIVDDGHRAAGIIDHLRCLYIKGAPPERELIDVNEVMSEMLGILRSEATRNSISMRMDLAPELPRVTADRVQLQQVFMNLMLNAIEAMKETRGELTIRSEMGQDGCLLISVIDTGVGLPVDHADDIFSAFFTTKPQGSGMGLTISRSIVAAHGGQLGAKANEGRGATFYFTLPVQTVQATAAD